MSELRAAAARALDVARKHQGRADDCGALARLVIAALAAEQPSDDAHYLGEVVRQYPDEPPPVEVWRDVVVAARRIAAAPAEQPQPVACVSVDTLSRMFEPLDGIDPNAWGYHWRKGWNDALRRAMDYASAAPPVPAEQPQPASGWRLVPVEPTEAMLAAGVAAETNAPTHVQERLTLFAYRAMLAAAPPPPPPAAAPTDVRTPEGKLARLEWLASLLPAEFSWGDPLHPEDCEHIALAAREGR